VPKEEKPYAKFLLDNLTKNESFDLIDSLTKNVFFDTENHEQIHYDFLKYFNKKETSDVVIKIGEESLYAHKVKFKIDLIFDINLCSGDTCK
jgi:hypothetical protein